MPPSCYREPSLEFARELMVTCGYAPSEVVYFGDLVSDLQTAYSAGTRTVGIDTGLSDLPTELAAAGLRDSIQW